MAVVLLVLSVILQKAIASNAGDNAAYAWTSWFVATILALWVAFSAPSGRIAFGRLCLLNGVATGLLLIAITALGATGAISSDSLGPQFTAPAGPALGSALLSAALGIIAVVFLVGAYLLLHSRNRRRGPATQS
jgi:hypothetical protein